MTSSLLKSLARVATRCRHLQKDCLISSPGTHLYTNNFLKSQTCNPAINSVGLNFSRQRHRVESTSAVSTQFQGKKPTSKKEIVRFLRDEIRLESESQKMKLELPVVPGFDVSVDGSLLVLTKDGDTENLKIAVDIINSLGREDTYNEDGEIDENVEPVFVSKPSFQVDFQREESTLVLRCSFLPEIYDGEEDLFFIEQFFVHEGSTNPQQFVGIARLASPELYDRFMSMLEERGIDNDFVQHLQELATAHEHRCYIRTLKDVVEFVAS